MQVDRKFKVFISSSCGGKYTYVRKALKKMIEDTGLAIAYVFESEPGSSEEVVSAYLEEVAECDVLIFCWLIMSIQFLMQHYQNIIWQKN